MDCHFFFFFVSHIITLHYYRAESFIIIVSMYVCIFHDNIICNHVNLFFTMQSSSWKVDKKKTFTLFYLITFQAGKVISYFHFFFHQYCNKRKERMRLRFCHSNKK